MKIHRIKTGKVKVKLNQISKANGMIPKLTKVFFDKQWSEWLPIYAWLIEHDEGLFAVDTGETHKTGIQGYLPKWHPYYAMAVQFDVKPEEEIGPQLSKMGIDTKKDVKKVIMTHLHTDHAGGMYHFPNSEILIEKDEFNSASGLTGIVGGYLPHRWPKWLNPTLINLNNQPFGPFEKSLSLTKDGSIMIVATPGHVATHMSVIVKMDGIYYFLAGDASYTERNMIKGIPDGVGTNDSEDTLEKIRDFTKKSPTVYLPSHDLETAHRMDNQIIVPLYEMEYEYSNVERK
jgi:glyoxylase-like metal-dependent hydrolase (beta-lactamase superfamily II)